MIRGRKRSVEKLKASSRKSRDSRGTSRLAEMSDRIEAARNVSLARRPVFDKKLQVVAYELVLGDGPITDIASRDGNDGTGRQLVVNSTSQLDIEAINADKAVQLAFSGSALLSGLPSELAPDRTMAILGADVEPSQALLDALDRHRALGYQIVLDDLVANPDLHPLLRSAHYAKIGHASADPAVAKRIAVLRESGVKLIANDIGSYEELRRATKAGFDHFQGSFLSRPDGFGNTKASDGQLSSLELITLLQDPDAEISDIADVIRRDVSLSYRIMKVVNSAYYSLQRPLGSIEEAVMLVGTRQIVSWVGMLSMSGINRKPNELTRTAMVRARTCERLAECFGRTDTQRFYLVGLFSVIEALLDVPAEQALRKLPLATEIVDAIVSGNGVMGEVLRGVVAYEEGNWDTAHIIGLDDQKLSDEFHLAILETDKVWSKITGSVA